MLASPLSEEAKAVGADAHIGPLGEISRPLRTRKHTSHPPGWLAIPCLLAAILCVWYYQRMSYKQFGGITGDLAGWFLQRAELFMLAALAFSGRWMG